MSILIRGLDKNNLYIELLDAIMFMADGSLFLLPF